MGQSQAILECHGHPCCEDNASIYTVTSAMYGSHKALSDCATSANHDLLRYARSGHKEGVSDALDRGAWTETRKPWMVGPHGGNGLSPLEDSCEGMTALMYASQNDALEVVARLLAARASINAVEEDGWTALHFAAKEQHLDICRALLESRADHELQSLDSETALTVAQLTDAFFARSLQDVLKDVLNADISRRWV